jgi:hypothetical protein
MSVLSCAFSLLNPNSSISRQQAFKARCIDWRDRLVIWSATTVPNRLQHVGPSGLLYTQSALRQDAQWVVCMTIKVKLLPPTTRLSTRGSKRRSGLIVILYCSCPNDRYQEPRGRIPSYSTCWSVLLSGRSISVVHDSPCGGQVVTGTECIPSSNRRQNILVKLHSCW